MYQEANKYNYEDANKHNYEDTKTISWKQL